MWPRAGGTSVPLAHARAPTQAAPASHPTPADAAMLQLHQSVPLEGVQLPSGYVVVYLAGGQAAMADMPGNKELERVVGQAAEAGGLTRLHSCVVGSMGSTPYRLQAVRTVPFQTDMLRGTAAKSVRPNGKALKATLRTPRLTATPLNPAAGRIVGTVCHGPAGLLGVKGPDGKPLVEGRTLACFTQAEEEHTGAAGGCAAARAGPQPATHVLPSQGDVDIGRCRVAVTGTPA